MWFVSFDRRGKRVPAKRCLNMFCDVSIVLMHIQCVFNNISKAEAWLLLMIMLTLYVLRSVAEHQLSGSMLYISVSASEWAFNCSKVNSNSLVVHTLSRFSPKLTPNARFKLRYHIIVRQRFWFDTSRSICVEVWSELQLRPVDRGTAGFGNDSTLPTTQSLRMEFSYGLRTFGA